MHTLTTYIRQVSPGLSFLKAKAGTLDAIAEKWLQHRLRLPQTYELPELLELVSDAFGVTTEQMKSNSRKGNVPMARQAYLYLAEKQGGNTQEVMAGLINQKSCAVVYARRKVSQYLEVGDRGFMRGFMRVINK